VLGPDILGRRPHGPRTSPYNEPCKRDSYGQANYNRHTHEHEGRPIHNSFGRDSEL
jgi:hypothetical protein